MINKFYEDKDGILAVRGFLLLLRNKLVKGSKNSNSNIGEEMTDYKKQYIEATKKLDLIEKELSLLSKSLSRECYLYWDHSDDFIAGMKQYSVKVDRIINHHFNPVMKTDLFGTGGWRNPIFRPVLDKNVF